MKGGGARRQERHRRENPESPSESRTSPQREQASPESAGSSSQQQSQIGTEERRGKGEPQRAQEEGRRAQATASPVLRSTLTTARHRAVPDGGRSIARVPESLWKTHLTPGVEAPLRTSIRRWCEETNLQARRLKCGNGTTATPKSVALCGCCSRAPVRRLHVYSPVACETT